jgi:hypothetical protein
MNMQPDCDCVACNSFGTKNGKQKDKFDDY